jgi:hypothetical protein
MDAGKFRRILFLNIIGLGEKKLNLGMIPR